METFCYRRYLGICGNRPEGRRGRRTGMTRGVGAAREGHVGPELHIVLITSRPGIRAAERGRRAEALRLNATDADLLGYLAQGLPDRQIGERLHLSPHTIKHYIERLRDTVGARNRIELASWAGRHGFYPQVREAIDADGTAVPRHASAHPAVNGAPIAHPRYATAVH